MKVAIQFPDFLLSSYFLKEIWNSKEKGGDSYKETSELLFMKGDRLMVVEMDVMISDSEVMILFVDKDMPVVPKMLEGVEPIPFTEWLKSVVEAYVEG